MDAPTFRWYIGGETNLAYNALDYHVKRGWGGHTAFVYINERGERQTFTYAQMLHEVKRLAAALRGMGIQKGDRVTIYMPTCPEAIMLMLALVRIGAIHIVVFAGFGAQALADRVQAFGSRLIFTSDITYRKGKDVQLKGIVDAALQGDKGSVEHVIVHHRAAESPLMQPGRDLTWQDFLSRAEGYSGSMYRWSRMNPPSSWQPRARRRNPNLPCIRTAATRFTSTVWASGSLA